MSDQNNNNEQKIQTKFPGLHSAMGVKPGQMEVLGTGAEGEGENTNTDSQNSGGEQNNGGTENNGGTGAGQQQQQQQPNSKNALDLDALSDDERSELLAKLTKGKIKSLDEIQDPPKQKTKEELEQEASQRRQEALAWAFDSGKLKREDYEDAIVLKSKSDRELALAAFTASLQAEDKDITPEEAAELFKDVYHEGQKEDSPLYKAGQREIKKLAEAFRNEKIGVLDEIEPEYESFTQTQSQYKDFRKKVKAIAETQPKVLDFAIPYKSADGAEESLTYSIPVDQKVLDKIVNEVTAEQSFAVRNIASDGKIDEKALATEISYHVKARLFDTAIPQLLQEHTKKVEEKLMVVLGNKRLQGPSLANGQQNTSSGGQQTNSYPGLKAWSAKNNR